MKGKRPKRLKGSTKCVTSSTWEVYLQLTCGQTFSHRTSQGNKWPLIKELWYIIRRTNDRPASLMYF
jgi:hypothetical protein